MCCTEEDGMQEIQRLDFGLYRELDHIISSEEDCGERERAFVVCKWNEVSVCGQ